jgi:diguanylate cyclase (GGDEF)-like protein
MFDRKWIYVFTIITLGIAILVNYFYPLIGFGMFFFIPMFGVIVLYPKWIVGHICSFVMAIMRFLTEYFSFSGHVPPGFLMRLINTSIISWFILLAVTVITVKLNNLIQKLEYLSLTDNLTKTFNRRYLELYSEKLLAHSLRNKQPLCFLIFDIDHFKYINDTYGHSVGDMVLQKLTHVIEKTTRQLDVFVRLGGEEFALFLPATPLEEGIHTAEKIRNTVQTMKFEFQEALIPVTISIGITQYLEGSLEQLIERADQALYLAKTNGRNQVASL